MLATELIARLQHIVDDAGDGVNVQVVGGEDDYFPIADVYVWNGSGQRWAEIRVEV